MNIGKLEARNWKTLEELYFYWTGQGVNMLIVFGRFCDEMDSPATVEFQVNTPTPLSCISAK